MGRNISKNVLNFNYKIMILVAKNADFSANSIGIVEIPRPMQAETLSILANYSSSQNALIKNALNKFVFNLKDKNIFEKLVQVTMPFLASSVDEAIKNALNGSPAIYTEFSGYDDNKVPATASSIELTDKCIKVVPGGTVAGLRFSSSGNSINTSDITVGAYVSKINTPSGANDCLFGNGRSSYFNRISEKSGNNGINFSNPSVDQADYGKLQDKHFIGESLRNGNAVAYFGNSKKTKNYTPSSVKIDFITLGNYKSNGTYSDDSNWGYFRGSIGMTFIGNGMSEEEFGFFKEQVELLMNAVL